jgi:AGCS family alanine or glycine:cation symporter
MKDYQTQRKAGIDPVFDASQSGIPNAEAWNKPEAVTPKAPIV